MEEKPRKRRDKYAASAERDVVEPTAMSSAVDSHTDSTMLTHCGGCLSDCSVCCYGLWCCCCMLGDNDKRVDGAVERNSRLCCCAVLLPCVACCGTFGAYKRLRIRYDYKPQPCVDCCKSVLCTLCAMCQIYRETELDPVVPQGMDKVDVKAMVSHSAKVKTAGITSPGMVDRSPSNPLFKTASRSNIGSRTGSRVGSRGSPAPGSPAALSRNPSASSLKNNPFRRAESAQKLGSRSNSRQGSRPGSGNSKPPSSSSKHRLTSSNGQEAPQGSEAEPEPSHQNGQE